MFDEEQLKRNLLEAQAYRDRLDYYIEAHKLLLGLDGAGISLPGAFPKPPPGIAEQEEEERQEMEAVFRSIADEEPERPQGYSHPPKKKHRSRRLRPLSDIKREVLDQMRDGKRYGPGELYSRMNGYSREEIRHALVWLKENDFLEHHGRGSYALRLASLNDPRLQAAARSGLDARDAQIEALARSGWTTQEIGLEFDITSSRVSQILHERGI